MRADYRWGTPDHQCRNHARRGTPIIYDFAYSPLGIGMPIYAYKCESCGHGQDVLQKISDPVLTRCPQCGAESFRKQVTAAGFQLKGSGWYVTDFRGGASGASGAAAASGGTASAATATASAAPSGDSAAGAAPSASAGSTPCGGSCACH
jgi:putative FmdB family regulatory protein